MTRAKQSDYLFFIKLHVGFPEHPKTGALSDKAFRALVELWCYCGRNLTDGVVSAAHLRRFLSERTRLELVAAGWLAEHPDGYEMLGYLDHQSSRQEVTDLRQHRAEAGRKGGQAKAKGVAIAKQVPEQVLKQTASKSVAETEVETEEELPTKEVVTSRRPKTGNRLPDDWQPSPRLIKFVQTECPAVDGRTATANFMDYWHSKSGKDAAKVDWDATYRKWMRTEQERASPPRPTTVRRSTTDERVGDALTLAQRLAAREKQEQRPQIERGA